MSFKSHGAGWDGGWGRWKVVMALDVALESESASRQDASEQSSGRPLRCAAVGVRGGQGRMIGKITDQGNRAQSVGAARFMQIVSRMPAGQACLDSSLGAPTYVRHPRAGPKQKVSASVSRDSLLSGRVLRAVLRADHDTSAGARQRAKGERSMAEENRPIDEERAR